jgi:molecular chaperone DnaK
MVVGKEDMKVEAVGIDLGTTFSALALIGTDGQTHPIPNAENTTATPSVVIWHQGAFLVGQPALDLIQQAGGDERDRLSASLIRGVKRMMGNPPASGLFSNGRHTTPIEVSSAILAKLARDASSRVGFTVKDAVITVPAHFGDKERTATREAAEMAGLHVLQMINEPSAAAITYTHGQQAKQGTALVFDLGGGTFDATILQLNEHGAKVLATKGIEELGGITFTNTLEGALRRRYETQTGIPYPRDNTSNDLLAVIAETTKCQLSQVTAITIQLAPATGPAITLEITRQYFESLIRLLLLQLQIAVEQAVGRAGKTASEIDRVLLCGGSSRIPAVQEMLAKFFQRAPESTLDLDLSVALGAAYQAAAYKEDPTTRVPALQLIAEEGLVLDCVSYPVGIAIRNAQGEPIKLVMLHLGDPLDMWSPSFPVRIVGTASSFPPIDVYSGEGTQLNVKDYLGAITIALPPDTPNGARGTVMLRQDQSGIVQVQIIIEGRIVPGILNRA